MWFGAMQIKLNWIDVTDNSVNMEVSSIKNYQSHTVHPFIHVGASEDGYSKWFIKKNNFRVMMKICAQTGPVSQSYK